MIEEMVWEDWVSIAMWLGIGWTIGSSILAAIIIGLIKGIIEFIKEIK